MSHRRPLRPRLLSDAMFAAALAAAAIVPAALPPGLAAQGAVGTVSRGAIGAPAPVARPVGGLVTTPLGGAAGAGGAGRGVTTGVVGWWPLRTTDLRTLPAGSRTIAADDVRAYVRRAPRWYPTPQPPTWQLDSAAPRPQGWRTVLVRDVVCDAAATCLERTTRVRATWVARWRGYYFADALGRWWRVE